ncbi:O-antigen ligase family protein [Altibacter lentus]|uniref:O-antigen ligase family protein n=1 Tax=Altibacter lentus TaxID=1223410 RepID=UPI000553783C|nr:O-antigen ligase family protein [Altibacter lentus]
MRKIKPIKKITYIQLLLLHIGMAFAIYLVEATSKFFLFAAVVYFLVRIFSSGNKKDEVLLAAAYIMGFEVFSRMTGGAFTYEFAKFAVIGFLVIGMFLKGFTRRSWPYVFYILFLVPGILFSAINLNYSTDFMNAISFNLSGPLCLAISALYCYNRKMPAERLNQILLAALLPIIAMAAYLYVYTPNIRDVLSGTQSNFEASGGFGPNQVSTILGLGMFILFSRLLTIKSRVVNIIDLCLLIFVSYRGIVTFSRGGVITAGVCALIFFIYYFYKADLRQRTSLLPKVAIIAGCIVVTWIFTSISTFGLIDKRYANQDAAGREKEDVTTGRAELVTGEVETFLEHPFTGIGVGKIREFRKEKTGRIVATHSEVSRILSEHGVFGLFALMVLVFTPLLFRVRNRTNLYFFAFFIFWFLTINHSSMRIAAPAFIYGLCLISIIDVKKKPALHRK